MNISQVSAVIMILAFLVTLAGAIFKHGNWLAAYFSFAAAWFSCQVAFKS